MDNLVNYFISLLLIKLCLTLSQTSGNLDGQSDYSKEDSSICMFDVVSTQKASRQYDKNLDNFINFSQIRHI